jgi:hypothetical protein
MCQNIYYIVENWEENISCWQNSSIKKFEKTKKNLRFTKLKL